MRPSYILDQKECLVRCVAGFGSCGEEKQSRGVRVAACNARHGAPDLLFLRWQICHQRICASINHPFILLELIFGPFHSEDWTSTREALGHCLQVYDYPLYTSRPPGEPRR